MRIVVALVMALVSALGACGTDGGGTPDGGMGVDLGASMTTADLATNADLGSVPVNGQWVLGYYVGYQKDDYPITDIDWTGLTHIATGAALVNADGTLDYRFYAFGNDSDGKAFATQLSTAAHAHGVKALLMLGGAGAGANIANAARAANRAAFVARLLDAVKSLGYDGIDLDWEDQIDWDDFIALVQALRASPDAPPGLILTVPVGPVNLGDAVEPKVVTLAQSLDRLTLMTYGPWIMAGVGYCWCAWHTSPLAGAHGINANGCAAPIAIDSSLAAYATAGVPKAKLAMGIGFFAMCYRGTPYLTEPGQTTDPNDPQCSNAGPYSFGGGDNDYPLTRFFASGGTFAGNGAAVKRDPIAKVPYLSLASAVNDANCGGSTRYVSYEDETSIIEKGTFSRQNGYGGVIIWTLAQGWLPSNAAGGRQRNALMQALKTGFLAP